MAASCDAHVVLLKSVSESDTEDEDNYTKLFRSAGFQVTLIPVLDFQFVNLDKLLEKLKNPDQYAGVIFASPRCVTGVELSVSKGNDKSVLDLWKQHKIFAVGEKTGKLAENLGFVVEGKESGNSNNLAEIISRDRYSKAFLYPKGSLTKDNFKLKLKESNIETDDIMVYETIPHREIESNLMNIKSQLTGQTVFVYFSPSGLHFTLPTLSKLGLDLNLIKFVAIGPTTEVALVQSGLVVSATASKPDPASLVQAVSSLSSGNNTS